MRTSRLLWLASMAILVSVAVRADEPAWLFDGFINDHAIRERFTAELIALDSAHKATSTAQLKAQLTRTNAVVNIESPSRRDKSWSDLYREAARAVLLVGRLYKCKKCNNWHTTIATGFFISTDGVFATNHHVFEADEVGPAGIMTADGRVLTIKEVLAASAKDDVALARVEGRGFPALAVRADAPVGTPVAVIGHLDTFFFTMTEGIVSRYYIRHDDKEGSGGGRRMAVTADYAKGSSGSPVIDAAGNVIGIASSTQSVYYNVENGHNENLQTVIKQCSPGRSILELIRKH